MATTIKPKQIFEQLDIAWAVRKNGGNYVPCFAGDSGIGKSEIQQAWAKNNGFELVDIRLAYMEGPDLVGLPTVVEITMNGKTQKSTVYALPEFLPKSGKALIIFEEPNRAHESTMNAIMQVFTDRKIGSYELPNEVLLSMAINPEGHYNVNSLDPALKNRVAMFDVKYDHKAFVDFMQEKKFHPVLLGFIADSGLWSYKAIDEIKESGVYISPRTISHVNNILNSIPDNHTGLFEAISGYLGTTTASDYIKFANEIRPVMWEDIKRNKKKALDKLAQLRDRPDYNGDMVSVTVTSVSQAFIEGKCKLDLVFEVIENMDKDQGVELLCAAMDQMGSDDLDKAMKDYEKEFETLKARVENRAKEVNETVVEQAKKRKSSKKEKVA